MTGFRKIQGILLALCILLLVLYLLDSGNPSQSMYRFLPWYDFLHEELQKTAIAKDAVTTERIIQKNGIYLREKVREENEQALLEQEETEEEIEDAMAATAGKEFFSSARLLDQSYILEQFFIVDSRAYVKEDLIDAEKFLSQDLSLKIQMEGPQILIYHSHSQENFCDSKAGKVEDTIVGVGAYLAELLTEAYGYQVVHLKEAFDLVDGKLDRSRAYDQARTYLKDYLKQHPTIQVMIDLHRDGVSEGRHLVTTIHGKPTAQIMFYNGLSHTVDYGVVDYLPNPYIEENLAFSFQLEYQAAQSYPGFDRGIYLAGLRYNLDFMPRSLLLEAGAQTNTVQEVKNAMEPFADILNRVLKGGDK